MARRLFLERIGLILLGSAILAFGVYNFYYLNNITEGGVLGILLLLKNLFNIQPAIANIVIDGLLLLVGYKFFGKKFLIYSIVASISFSVLYDLFEAIGPLVLQSQNMLLSTILAGITVGVGVGIIVKAGCASGGDDALALVISKTTSLNIGQVYLATDVIVLLLSLVYLSAFDIFYSLIAVTISGKVIDFIYYHGKNLDMDMSNEIVPEC
ncbi:YitT family protein [Clostridioides sp. ES-S-0049-02]|uniref:YitT family protein n=1 Tax=Clostridioides sp. ES-S-0049-02 TaxID=2770778 RepID=UPI001D12010A|nr:YitT family protein [Clostridioides sp. ES-S-0049-02]